MAFVPQWGARTTTLPVYLAGLLLAGSFIFAGRALMTGNSQPAAPVRYVAPAGACGGHSPCYSDIQTAVDAADQGDEIRIAAGTYSGVSVRPRQDWVTTGVVTQVVYLAKTLSLSGGYPAGFAGEADPLANLTVLDAAGQGRVFYLTGAISPVIQGLTITGGKASGQLDDGSGAGMFIYQGNADIRDNRIISNSAAAWGGGLYLFLSSALVSNNQILSNTAVYDGGGLVLDLSPAVIRGNNISGNVSHRGGGLTLSASSAQILENTIAGNSAVSLEGYGGAGGGLGIGSGGQVPPVVANNLIASNWSSRDGGGLYVHEGSIDLTGNTIVSNTAGMHGGGVFVTLGSGAIRGNSIRDNWAADWGGGLFVDQSALTIAGNTVISNTGLSGGGLYLQSAGDTVRANVIMSNTASGWGGGLLLRGSETLENNVVAGNRATTGAGLYVWGASPRLVHNTIARNTSAAGDGVGIRIVSYDYELGESQHIYSQVALTNTIFASQKVDVHISAGNAVTVNGVLWYGTPVTFTRETGAAASVQHARAGNPVFAADGYHLQASSAAMGAGVATAMATDIDGEPRKPLPDLGADEYWAPGALRSVFLPLVMRDHP